MIILAIDPGTTRSAMLAYDTVRGVPLADWLVVERNETVVQHLGRVSWPVVIEKVESYGMPVGAEVFETVYWSGRFAQAAWPLPAFRLGRMAVKMHLCHSPRANDAAIRQALIDRYGGKDAAIGRKAAPGPLYGIRGDLWAALALAVTWADNPETTA